MLAERFWLLFLGCRAKIDLAFVIDGSGSIEAYGKGNFQRCLNFVRAIVSQFRINNGQTRIGVVLFSSRPRLIFDFRRYRRKSQVLNAISRIRYPRGGTKTGNAMRYTYYRVFRYARGGARKVNCLLSEFLTLLPRDSGTKVFYTSCLNKTDLEILSCILGCHSDDWRSFIR